MYPQNQSSGSGNLQPPGGGCSTTAAPGDDNCSFYRFLETMQQIHEEYSAKFNYEQSLRQFENSLNELNNVQRQLEYIEQNIKFDKQIAESLKNLGVDYRPSNMDQLFKSSYEGQYHKLVDKVNANLNKTVQNYQQYNNVVTGKYTVYSLNDPVTGEVKYIGRTVNPSARQYQHLNSLDKCDLEFNRLKDGLSYEQVRGLEQILFDKYGGINNLLNKIRPISPFNPKITIYIQAANGVL